MHSSNQMSGFKDRIKKIEDPRFQYYVDPETGMHIPRHLTRDQVGNQNVSSGTILGMSFILGMLCLLVARYLRMEVINVEPYFPDGLMTEMAMACLAAFVIGGFMRMKSFKTALAQFAGALVCAITMHNAVWMAPDQFATVFSQDYVDRILGLTEPMSVYVNGMTFALVI